MKDPLINKSESNESFASNSSGKVAAAAGGYKRRYKIACIASILLTIGLILTIVLFLVLQKNSYSRLAQLNINNTHTIEEKNELIARLTDEVENLTDTVQKQQDKINEQQATIDNQKDTIRELNQTIAQQKTIIDNLNTQVGELQNTIASKDKEIADKNSEIADMQVEIDELKKGIIPTPKPKPNFQPRGAVGIAILVIATVVLLI